MPCDSFRLLSDGELVEATLSGDAGTFRVIVERHGILVLAYLVRHTHSRSTAEDLAQEVFLTAYQELGRLKNPDLVRSWLFGICRNKVREWLRTNRRGAAHVPLDSPADTADGQFGPDEQASSKEMISVVTEIVNGMGPVYKPVVWMRLMEELTFPEISERLNIKESTARMRFTRGASILRKTLEKKGLGKDRFRRNRDV